VAVSGLNSNVCPCTQQIAQRDDYDEVWIIGWLAAASMLSAYLLLTM
jgi:hypothetical protein